MKLFLFIFSKPYDVNKRQTIRETWLNQTVWGGRHVEYVFIVGHQDLLQESRLQAEAGVYHDIMVVNFSESFNKLTLKALSGLHVAIHHCPNAMYVMKTDDDMFINMFLLQDIIDMLVRTKKTEKVLMGHVWYNGEVFREGKYAVSREQYPWSHFPAFCSGSGYIMSKDVTVTLFDEAMRDNGTVMLHLDDPYITGILAQRAGLTHTNIRSLYRITGSDTVYEDLPDYQLRQLLVLHLQGKTGIIGELKNQFALTLWRRLLFLYGKL